MSSSDDIKGNPLAKRRRADRACQHWLRVRDRDRRTPSGVPGIDPTAHPVLMDPVLMAASFLIHGRMPTQRIPKRTFGAYTADQIPPSYIHEKALGNSGPGAYETFDHHRGAAQPVP